MSVMVVFIMTFSFILDVLYQQAPGNTLSMIKVEEKDKQVQSTICMKNDVPAILS